MPSNKLILVLFVALIVVSALLLRQCQGTSKALDAANKLKVISDSNAEANKINTIRLFATLNAYNSASIRWQHDSTALIQKYQQSDHQVNIEKQKVGDLVAEYQIAKATGDTVLALRRCDSLAYELGQAKTAVTALQASADTNINALGEELDRRAATIGQLTEAAQNFRAAFLKEHQTDSLAIQLAQKEAKQGAKKWAIGPTGGITYLNNSFRPFIGIGVTYTFIKL